MGLVMDIVPNHMGVMGSDNRWWLDLLENGQASIRADYFGSRSFATISGFSSCAW